MSRDIIIQNNGVAVTYTGAKKMKTRKSTGGTLYWLPEGEQPTGTITITENGTYKAEDENLYAFSQAIVNVQKAPTNISGKGQDGNEYNVTIDPETGEIVETEIPSAIQIEIPPLKNSYTEDEPIDLTGIVVKLIDGNGNVFTDTAHPDGTIPLSELTPVPATAHTSGEEREYSDGDGLNVLLVTFTTPTERAAIFCGDVALGVYEGKSCTIAGSANTASTLGTQVYVTRYGDVNYYYGLDLKGANYIQTDLYDIDTGDKLGVSNNRIYQSEWEGARVWTEYLTDFPVSTKRPTNADIGNLQPIGATISVNWTRVDGAVLSDTFDIFIESSESGSAH